MNSAVSNLIISLGAMQVARKIPFEDPEVLNYVRIGYAATQLITLAIYFYTSYKIKAKNDQTVLKFVEPANPMSPDSGGLVTTTNRDYDLGEVSKLLKGVYMGVAMMGFLHIYMKYTQPLFVQALMGLKNLYEAKPVVIHILGRKAEGDLKRPFKGAPSMFGAAGQPATDKAAIDEAEKRVGGSKEE
ncbi:inorganic phosphate transporter Pho88 [Gautieria morchelliformis]|nr:inorganic phosphate transporter Pho88 [Gautieria morchelliformis]